MGLGNHCLLIEGHWEILGSWVVTSGRFRLYFGRPWKWVHIEVIWCRFGQYENQWFLLILRGWRLDDAHFGSLGSSWLDWWLVGWQLARRLMG